MQSDSFDTISKGIYEKIIELSDVSLQRQLWLNEGNATGLVSSYVELMCGLFDDYHFDEFVDIYAANLGFSQTLRTELNTLREMLDNYDEEGRSDAEVLDDLVWMKIAEQAGRVRDLWEFMLINERQK